MVSTVADPDPALYINADPDPDPVFHFCADPDQAPLQSDEILQPLVFRFSRAPPWASSPPLWAFMALQGSILSL
jgi:hypothetical protein